MKKLLSIALLSLMVLGLSSVVMASPEVGTFTGPVVDAEYGEPVAGRRMDSNGSFKRGWS